MSTDYAALANTINIDDITSDDTNRDVLRSLKNNDPEFEQFCITDERGEEDEDAYHPIDGEDMGWLGYYVGNSIYLREITFFQTIDTESSFYKEMSNNIGRSKVWTSHIITYWMERYLAC